MRTVRFAKGRATVIAFDGLVVFLDEEPVAARVEGLRSALRSGAPLEGVLGVLVADGLTSLPTFAAVDLRGSAARIVIRGPVRVVVDAGEDSQGCCVDGTGVQTWSEHVVAPGDRCRVELVGAEDHAPMVYEVSEGTFPASAVEVERPATALEAAPAVERSAGGDPKKVGTLAGPTLDDPGLGDSVPESAPEPEPESEDEVGNGTEADPSEQHPAMDLPAEGEYDSLIFGETEFRSVEDAAVRPDAEEPVGGGAHGVITEVPVASSGGDVDHDGFTVSFAELQRIRGSGPVPDQGPVAQSEEGTGPVVHAVKCPVSHLNPPHADRCRVCGSPIEDQVHLTVPRPVLGRCVFSDGQVVGLVSGLVVGRNPKLTGALAADVPVLVSVTSPSKEVSGTHAEVRIDGWQVLVVDRQSTNGTIVTLPDREPMLIRAGEPVPVIPGTRVTLADEVWFTYEVGE